MAVEYDVVVTDERGYFTNCGHMAFSAIEWAVLRPLTILAFPVAA